MKRFLVAIKQKHIINGKDGKINTVDYDDDGLFDSAERDKINTFRYKSLNTNYISFRYEKINNSFGT